MVREENVQSLHVTLLSTEKKLGSNKPKPSNKLILNCTKTQINFQFNILETKYASKPLRGVNTLSCHLSIILSTPSISMIGG